MANNQGTQAQQDAIRGIKANWPPNRVKVFDRTRDWGCFEVKAGGQVFLVMPNGRIVSCG